METARKLKTEWVAKEGSIFTTETEPLKVGMGGGKIIHVQGSIAFNVGQEMAEYLVKLHNDRLRLRTSQ